MLYLSMVELVCVQLPGLQLHMQVVAPQDMVQMLPSFCDDVDLWQITIIFKHFLVAISMITNVLVE